MSAAPQHAVLMVDDEANVLSAYRRTLGRKFDLTCAASAKEGLALIEGGKAFAVVISDMTMPEVNGLEFIAAARTKNRESVYMMLTGNAEPRTAIDGINKGQLFRFLSKPCSTEHLEEAIRSGLRQYELTTAERVVMRETVSGSVKLLMEALEVSCPTAFGFQSATKRIQQEVCKGLGAPPDWQVGFAATLCLVGLVSVGSGASAGNVLSEASLSVAAEVGARLLGHIPRMQSVAQMIRRQREPGNLPDDLASTAAETIETTGARVLRFSVDLAREEREKGNRGAALAALSGGGRYDRRLLSAISA